MSALHLEIRGVVQGVGYRWYARERARRRGLSGWVRNLPDGSVEVAVAGDSGEIEAFVADLRSGPAGARVDDVRRTTLPPDQSLPLPFSIER